MKYAENDKEDCLLASADKAMTQILDKHYGDDAIKIGIGNHQKKARITWKCDGEVVIWKVQMEL